MKNSYLPNISFGILTGIGNKTRINRLIIGIELFHFVTDGRVKVNILPIRVSLLFDKKIH